MKGERLMKKRFLIMTFLLPLALIPIVSAAVVLTVSPHLAQQPTQAIGAFDRLGIAVGAGLAIGLAAIGAGLAISAAGTAAISALAEKPETFFRSFLVVALAESLAIYGLIMGILLWLKL